MDSEVEQLALLCTLICESKKKKRRKKQNHWVKEIYQRYIKSLVLLLLSWNSGKLEKENTSSSNNTLYMLNLTHLENLVIYCNNNNYYYIIMVMFTIIVIFNVQTNTLYRKKILFVSKKFFLILCLLYVSVLCKTYNFIILNIPRQFKFKNAGLLRCLMILNDNYQKVPISIADKNWRYLRISSDN